MGINQTIFLEKKNVQEANIESNDSQIKKKKVYRKYYKYER